MKNVGNLKEQLAATVRRGDVKCPRFTVKYISNGKSKRSIKG